MKLIVFILLLGSAVARDVNHPCEQAESLHDVARHPVSCAPNEVMSGFRFSPSDCAANLGRFTSNCQPASSREYFTKKSNCTQMLGRKLNDLNGTTIECDEGQAINAFRAFPCDYLTYRFAYFCVTTEDTVVTEKVTPCVDTENKPLSHLAQFDPDCGSEFLKSISFQGCEDGKSSKIVYTCSRRAELTPDIPEKVDCVMSPWGKWSPCLITKQCSTQGTQYRVRRVMIHPKNGGASCPSDSYEEKECKAPPCAKHKV